MAPNGQEHFALAGQEPEVEPVLKRVQDIMVELGLRGSVCFFGSYASGLRTAGSDCDIVFIPEDVPGQVLDTPVMVLQKFAAALPKHGYTHIVTVLQALVPLVKAVDPDGLDVDLSVANILGYHNSRLLGAYCRLDERVARLGHLVKQWAHHYELIGSSDGHLNSYGYSLLAVFFLMQTSPPIVPNLQALAEGDKDPPTVQDNRWGVERTWECGYWEDVHIVPRTWNTMSIEELLVDFFEFYLSFDWARHAVSIRLALRCGVDADGRRKLPDKFNGLHSRVAREVWYVEDPFDLGHNLAAKCTVAGRRRIWESMRQTHEAIKGSQGSAVIEAFDKACPKKSSQSEEGGGEGEESKPQRNHFLKCRINAKKLSAEAFAKAFADYSVVAVHYPANATASATATWPETPSEAFIVFPTQADCKLAHTINETYVSGWQLRLFSTSKHALEDATASGAQFDEIPGWEAAKKEDEDSKSKGGRWKKESDAERKERAGAQVLLQRRRVIDGVEHAEGVEELNVLRQRAAALGLQREVKKCDEKLQSFRGTREARSGSDGAQAGSRQRIVSGGKSPHMGPAQIHRSPSGPQALAAPAASGPGVQFQ